MIDDKFNSRIDKNNKIIHGLKKSINTVATIRLFNFILILFIAYKYLKIGSSNLYLSFLLIAMGALIVLVMYHSKLKNNLKFANGILLINKSYLDRIGGSWINFSDFGEDFIDKTHAYSNDLDIVGKGSLFQRINLSHNYMGRKKLADDLLYPKYNIDQILERQKSIEELGSKLDFIQNLEYASMNTKVQDPDELITYFDQASKNSYSKVMQSFLKLLPIIVILISIVVLSFQIKPLFILVFF